MHHGGGQKEPINTLHAYDTSYPWVYSAYQKNGAVKIRGASGVGNLDFKSVIWKLGDFSEGQLNVNGL